MRDTAAQFDATEGPEAQAASKGRLHLAGVPAETRKLWGFGSIRLLAGYALVAIGIGAMAILLFGHLDSASRQYALEGFVASALFDTRLHTFAFGGDAGIAFVIGALILINIWVVNRKLRDDVAPAV